MNRLFPLPISFRGSAYGILLGFHSRHTLKRDPSSAPSTGTTYAGGWGDSSSSVGTAR